MLMADAASAPPERGRGRLRGGRACAAARGVNTTTGRWSYGADARAGGSLAGFGRVVSTSARRYVLGAVRRRLLVLPLAAAAAGALALIAPSIAGQVRATLGPDEGPGCWRAEASRFLVSDSPVRSTGSHCGPSQYGTWRWSGTTDGPVGRVVLRWSETIRPDGRPGRLRLLGVSAGPAQATAARALYHHVRFTTVTERAGEVRATLHGWRTSFPFRPSRS
jgi:hypothetical protein